MISIVTKGHLCFFDSVLTAVRSVDKKNCFNGDLRGEDNMPFTTVEFRSVRSIISRTHQNTVTPCFCFLAKTLIKRILKWNRVCVKEVHHGWGVGASGGRGAGRGRCKQSFFIMILDIIFCRFLFKLRHFRSVNILCNVVFGVA
jgi:hypothetical protein